jgi:HipA-like protein
MMMTDGAAMTPELGIYLDDLLVGILRLRDGSRSEFHLQQSYKETYPRPILGQCFEDDLDRVYSAQVRLPAFFSDLLPEWPLRRLIADEIEVKELREFFLLAHLGNDLPGAVRALPLTELDRELAAADEVPPAPSGPGAALLPGRRSAQALDARERARPDAADEGRAWRLDRQAARRARMTMWRPSCTPAWTGSWRSTWPGPGRSSGSRSRALRAWRERSASMSAT